MSKSAKFLFVSVLALALGGTAYAQAPKASKSKVARPKAAAATGSMDTISTNALIKLIQAEGYQNVDTVGDDAVKIVIDGRSYGIFNHGDKGLMFYAGFKGYTVNAERMNNWNNNFRFSRGYIDKDGDPCVEWDLVFKGGVTKRNIIESLKLFIQVTDRFHDYIKGE